MAHEVTRIKGSYPKRFLVALDGSEWANQDEAWHWHYELTTNQLSNEFAALTEDELATLKGIGDMIYHYDLKSTLGLLKCANLWPLTKQYLAYFTDFQYEDTANHLFAFDNDFELEAEYKSRLCDDVQIFNCVDNVQFHPNIDIQVTITW